MQKKIFSSEDNLSSFEFSIQYQHLLSEVLKVSILPSPQIHQQLLQLMELIEKSITEPDFPNQGVKTFFSDEANKKVFKEHIQQLKKTMEVPTLLTTASHSPKLMVNVALQLKAMEQRLQILEGKNLTLETENKTLKEKVEQLETQANVKSTYDTNLTLFPSSSSASSSSVSTHSNSAASVPKKM